MSYVLPANFEILYEIATELRADFREANPVPLADDIDARIAAGLNVPLAPYSTSLDAAFALKEIVFEGVDYINVDFRDYCLDGKMSYICDLKNDGGDTCGDSMSRSRALVAVGIVRCPCSFPLLPRTFPTLTLHVRLACLSSPELFRLIDHEPFGLRAAVVAFVVP
jgi:hypothetical protein